MLRTIRPYVMHEHADISYLVSCRDARAFNLQSRIMQGYAGVMYDLVSFRYVHISCNHMSCRDMQVLVTLCYVGMHRHFFEALYHAGTCGHYIPCVMQGCVCT